MERSRNEFHKRVLAEALSEQFGLALIAGDAAEAERAAREGFESELGEERLYELVVKPAMHRIGQLWRDGEISVAHEHLATQIATRVLVLIHELARLPAERIGRRAMLAGVEGELHVLALDMAAKLLESAGYETLFLGPDVPVAALPAIVDDHDPALFLLSATMPDAGAAIPDAVSTIMSSGARVGVIVGGAGVPSEVVPGPRVSVERTVTGVVDAADGLVRGAGLN